MARPIIIADENIPYVREAFADLGDVSTLAGRKMTAEGVKDADILLVRSVTRVDAALLRGSRVRFVGTATIGEDHIDKEYLAKENIKFDSAPGSNADSVADYVSAALVELAAAYALDLTTMSLGVVGVGNVGSRVALRCEALGMKCVLNDPPLSRLTGDAIYRPVEEVFDCDVITVHVPLTKDGPDATHRLVNDRFVGRLKEGAIFINTARGPVMDEAVIHHALDSGKLRTAVLDVWDAEPVVDSSLLAKVFIGTPHIAGYSFDGKVNGTIMLYRAVSRFLGKPAEWDPSPLLPSPDCAELHLSASDGRAAVREAVQAVYPIRRDDEAMRSAHGADVTDRPAQFDRLRKEYPRRREFSRTRIVLDNPGAPIAAILKGLTFNVAE